MSATRRLPTSNRPPPANRVLAALPADVLDRIVPSLDVVPLKLKQFLHKSSEAFATSIFFPGGFIWMVTVLKDGAMYHRGHLTIVDREKLESRVMRVLSHGD